LDLGAQPQPLDLRGYARILWRRKWIFLAVVVAVPVLVYVISASATKTYESSVLMEVHAAPVDTSLLSGQGNLPTDQSVAIAARLIQTPGVAEAAARQLRPPRPSALALLNSISVSVDSSTLFITITAKAVSAQRAAAIANAFGSAVDATRTRQAIGVIDTAMARVRAQIASLPAGASAAKSQLSGQLQRLHVLRDAQGSNAQVIQAAGMPLTPVSPRPRRDALLGLVVAVLLGLGLVAVAESLDRRIRQPEDLEGLTGLALLTSVPRSAFGGGLDDPSTMEAFRSLRANLEFFNVDRDIDSLVITSGRKGEGKTMVAINLSHAYALGGADVILVEGDLRRPTIASRLDVPAGDGLAGVLVGKATLAEALIEREPEMGAIGRLRVLPAGGVPPPNPAELLRSERMHRLIEELSRMCDLVIIDTGPILAVSDALPLLDRVSGTLLVARLGVIQREELAHLRKLLDTAQSLAVGIVATGTKKRESYPYAYSAYVHEAETASTNGSPARRPLALLGRRRH
jgi:capsular exopolysaccharide synthesis family protein